MMNIKDSQQTDASPSPLPLSPNVRGNEEAPLQAAGNHLFEQKFTERLMHRHHSIILYPAEEKTANTIVEVGPGNGDFLFHLAELHPEKMIFGIEIKSIRFDKLIERREKRGISNVKLALANAALALPELFPDQAVDAIYINFPDPWPKRKHAKNRLLQKEFIDECARTLKNGGTLSITTDVEWYAEKTFDIISGVDSLQSESPAVSTTSDNAYPTYFAQKWKREGRTIYYQKYKRIHYCPV